MKLNISNKSIEKVNHSAFFFFFKQSFALVNVSVYRQFLHPTTNSTESLNSLRYLRSIHVVFYSPLWHYFIGCGSLVGCVWTTSLFIVQSASNDIHPIDWQSTAITVFHAMVDLIQNVQIQGRAVWSYLPVQKPSIF